MLALKVVRLTCLEMVKVRSEFHNLRISSEHFLSDPGGGTQYRRILSGTKGQSTYNNTICMHEYMCKNNKLIRGSSNTWHLSPWLLQLLRSHLPWVMGGQLGGLKDVVLEDPQMYPRRGKHYVVTEHHPRMVHVHEE